MTMQDCQATSARLQRLEAELAAARAELAESEAARRAAEASLDDLQHVAQIGSWEWSLSDNRVRWSDQLYRIWGLTDRRIDSLDAYLALLSPEQRALAEPLIRRAIERGESYAYELTIRPPEGPPKHVQCRGRVQLDAHGRPARLVGTLQDVTERVTIERELKAHEGMLRAVVEHAKDTITIRDLEGRCLLANQAMGAVLGLSVDEMLGLRDADVLSAETIAAMRATDRQVAEEGLPLTYELRMANDRGHLATLQVTKYPFRSPEGEVSGIISIGRDISDRLEQERLREERIVQLEELNRLKADLVNAVSHEVRTPLTSIKGYAEFLLDELGGPLTPMQAEFVGQIEWSTRRLEALVDDLLDSARMEAGVFKLVLAEADMCAQVHGTVANFEPQLREAGVAVAVECQGPPLVARMDVRRVTQVLVNLLSNAIKFTPSGGRITLRARHEGDRLRCEVADTGVGIAPEDLPKLFHRFSQLSHAPAQAVKGTGLGLSISKAIVEAHQGAIGVTSAPGAGSTFWFTLPVV